MRTIVAEANSNYAIFNQCVFASMSRNFKGDAIRFCECLNDFVGKLYEINQTGTNMAGVLMKSIKENGNSRSESNAKAFVQNVSVA